MICECHKRAMMVEECLRQRAEAVQIAFFYDQNISCMDAPDHKCLKYLDPLKYFMLFVKFIYTHYFCACMKGNQMFHLK